LLAKCEVMKKILLPTDFSDSAWNAITYAMDFFKNEVCTFYLLHAYTPAFYRMDYILGGPMFSAIPDAEVDISLAGLEKTHSDIKNLPHNPKHHFEEVSAFNVLTHEINDLTQEKDIDLIVMGTKGATGAKEVFIGSNTVYVLRKATAPVFVVPVNSKYKSVKKVLFPTDYLTQYKEHEFQHLIELVKMSGGHLTILHVKEEYELSEAQLKNKTHLATLLKGIPHTFAEENGKLMPEAVIKYIDQEKFDLLAMMNRKHSILDRLFVKHNVDQLSFHVQVPFFVVRDTAKVASRSATNLS